MNEITVIIPILELNDNVKYTLFANAVNSAKEANSIIIVGDANAIKSAKSIEKEVSNILFLENNGVTSYQSQVNLAVKEVKTKYFSVLEYDDVYTNIWFKNLNSYLSTDSDNTFAFLPLTEIVNYETKQTIGYANEAFWASSFSEEIGCPDITCMDGYLNFNTSGAIFKTDEFISLGGLKESMKLVFWYEFILRALNKQKKMFVIPKVGYLHMVNREGSLSDTYQKTMSEKEADWWIELSKKEYYFTHDRKKTYEE